MGYYIEGPAHGKVEYITYRHEGKEVTKEEAREVAADPSSELAAICVVNNGPFEAAGLIFDKKEWDDFTHPSDLRPKRFLVMDKKLAHKLSGYSNGR